MPKTAIVTGGAVGIGKAIVERFCNEGWRVCFSYLKSETAAKQIETEQKGQAFAIKTDVSNSRDVDRLFECATNRFGSLDAVICNAGTAQQKQIQDITDNDFLNITAVNLNGVFYCCRAAAKYFIPQKKGSIVNISSVYGINKGSCEVHYSAAKAGVIGLTRALACELAPSNIRVNCIAPGIIDTDMNMGYDKNTLPCNVPAGRMGTPFEIAGAAFFLAGDTAAYISGQVILQDGGWMLDVRG